MGTEGVVTTGAGELFFERRGTSGGAPLVCVHGGPGFTSHYLEPLFALSDVVDVVCYDQAGCGRARRSGFRRAFSLAAFVEELEALRQALQVESMHLLGHSFGGAIIGEYILAHPNRVRSAVFASVSIDIPRWVEDGQRLVSQMPLMARMILRDGERTGQFHTDQYLRALAVYYEKHVIGCSPMPDLLKRSQQESDGVTYATVWGPNELVVSGLVSQYSLTPRLPDMSCPALFTCGRLDEATPEAHELFASLVPGARCEIFENSAHHPHITEEAAYLLCVRRFIEAAAR